MSTSINYGSTEISSISGDGSKTLQCAGKYMAYDVTVQNSDTPTLTATITVQTVPLSTVVASQDSSSYTTTASSEGTAIIQVGKAGTWTITVTTPTSSTYTSSCVVAQNINVMDTLPRVGGRIFYIGGDNGASYKFFTQAGEELTTITVAGLANAYYYQKLGTASGDRFYAFDNNLASSYTWGYYVTSTGITTDGIGRGKTNTETILARADYPSGTTPNIWQYAKGKRDANYNGCNDWFIPSKAEQDQLRAANLVSWYSSNNIWSSVEFNNSNGYTWYSSSSAWFGNDKGYAGSKCFACRAF